MALFKTESFQWRGTWGTGSCVEGFVFLDSAISPPCSQCPCCDFCSPLCWSSEEGQEVRTAALTTQSWAGTAVPGFSRGQRFLAFLPRETLQWAGHFCLRKLLFYWWPLWELHSVLKVFTTHDCWSLWNFSTFVVMTKWSFFFILLASLD